MEYMSSNIDNQRLSDNDIERGSIFKLDNGFSLASLSAIKISSEIPTTNLDTSKFNTYISHGEL